MAPGSNAAMNIIPKPHITASVITSCFVASDPTQQPPLEYAIQQLRKAGITHAELYAFMPDDINWLIPNQSTTPRRSQRLLDMIAALDTASVIQKLQQWLNSGDNLPLHPVALATYIPSISSPDIPKRKLAVEALKNIGICAAKLKVPVVEIVGGPNITRLKAPRNNTPPYQQSVLVGEASFVERLHALKESLRELAVFVSDKRLPITYALEIEPGISYIINSVEVAKMICDEIDHQSVSINLDLGHLQLLGGSNLAILHTLLDPGFMKLVSHAHISRHSYAVHASDLNLRVADRDIFRPFIDVIVDAYQQRRIHPRASHAISLELEGCSKVSVVRDSQLLIENWIHESEERYTWLKWMQTASRPRERSVVVLSADIVSSTTMLDTHPDIVPEIFEQLIPIVEELITKYGGCYDKFTGDGFLAFWIAPSNPAQLKKLLLTQILQCGFELRELIHQQFSQRKDINKNFKGSRVALAYGKAWIGVFGQRQHCCDETIVGPPAVHACRLASHRDIETVQGVLVSEAFYGAMGMEIPPGYKHNGSISLELRGISNKVIAYDIHKGL